MLWDPSSEPHDLTFSDQFVRFTIAFSAAAIASALREYTNGYFKTNPFSLKNSEGNYKEVLDIVRHDWHDEVGSIRCQSFCMDLRQLVSALGVHQDT